MVLTGADIGGPQETTGGIVSAQQRQILLSEGSSTAQSHGSGRQWNQRWRLEVRLLRSRHFKIRHGTARKEIPARFRHPPSPAPGPGNARAVRGYAGIRIHEPVDSGDKHKCHAAAARLNEARTLPNGTPTVETVPYALGSGADLFGGHYRMVPIQLGTKRLRYKPAPSKRNSCNGWRVVAQRLFPTIEIDGPGIGTQGHELREGAFRADGGSGSSREGFRTIAGQTENERAEHVHAVTPECPKLFREFIACQVEVLVDILQSFRGNRFHADQGALDARRLHGIEELQILGRFHRDLSKENHVIRELGETRHQLKPLRPKGFQFIQPGGVFLLSRQAKVGQSDGIEVVIRQRNKTKAQPA